MTNLLIINKPIGMTPLQCIYRFKQRHPEDTNAVISYAGRLDPMAEGLLLLLVGEENKRRQQYENLQKEYECEILFGIATDSYDLLGKIVYTSPKQTVTKQDVQIQIHTYVGQHVQPYPPYSSQPVNGKPLYYWARQNKLDAITILTKDIEIYAIALCAMTEINKVDLGRIIVERIGKVHGDFRQKDILEGWKSFLEQTPEETFSICKLKISCSSGTYIRSLANRLGEDLQTGALAFSIKRTKIGEYTLENAITIE